MGGPLVDDNAQRRCSARVAIVDLQKSAVALVSTLPERAAGNMLQVSIAMQESRAELTSVSQSRFSILYLRSRSAQALGGWKVLLNTMSFSSSTFSASRSFSWCRGCNPVVMLRSQTWQHRGFNCGWGGLKQLSGQDSNARSRYGPELTSAGGHGLT